MRLLLWLLQRRIDGLESRRTAAAFFKILAASMVMSAGAWGTSQALLTLQEYNAAAKHASDGFDPTQKDGMATAGLALEKSNWATKIEKPPYYAYTATGGITFTFGGLKVDENARVIGTDWRPIPGLLACGEMIGGLFYDNYPAGTGLVSGATFGRIAGRTAAQLQSNSRPMAASSVALEGTPA